MFGRIQGEELEKNLQNLRSDQYAQTEPDPIFCNNSISKREWKKQRLTIHWDTWGTSLVPEKEDAKKLENFKSFENTPKHHMGSCCDE